MEPPGVLREEYRVGAPLQSVWLVPDWLTSDDERDLLARCDAPSARWTRLHGRSVQSLGGVVHDKAGLLAAPLPKWALPLLERLTREVGLFSELPVNHVLINAYEPGAGIMPHQDGPLYAPVVAIISLGSHCVFTFTPHASLQPGVAAAPVRVLVPPRSLLLFAHDAYDSHLHGIDACAADDLRNVANPPSGAGSCVPRTGRRVSLTCRAVLRVRRGLVPGT
jgi:alkylated DNA repair protein alkB family protein 6